MNPYKAIAIFVVCGIFMRVGCAPVHLPLSILLSLLISALVIVRSEWGICFIGGFIVGGLWNSYLLVGIAPWGIWFAVIAWLVSCILIGLYFYFVRLVALNVRPQLGCVIIPVGWVVLVYCSNFYGYPLAIMPALVISNNDLVRFISAAGFYLGEFLVAFYLFSFVIYFSIARVAGVYIFLIVMLVNLVFPIRVPSAVDVRNIAVVQPAIRYERYIEAGRSLYQRKEIESAVDRLTYSAILTGADMVVWPESANGLANINLPHRLSILEGLIAKGNSELIVTGMEYGPDNKKFNSAFLFASGRMQRTRKSITAPVAESNLRGGEAVVFDSRIGKVGVAICFEGLFDSHYRNLVNGGADLLFVLTDDSSLAFSSLPEIHAAYAVLYSMIYGRPLLFSSNRTVSFVTDNRGRTTYQDSRGNVPRVNLWKMSSAKFDRDLLVTNQMGLLLFFIGVVLVGIRRV
ncbi:nitrilase-related carbon-nitrogen hydrolase [Pseudomonas aeruginosa]|uniref:nitrilase-related carbon-nitrogen hydrolase n=1 Tax=Pseudomonas aeruginosa TaxID=287 RepID=UPI0009A2C0C2|nr:nitrilase-related carbon-nitrogen hydrolase [Pseudomonas aeruginosa]AUA68710.1 hypothetical protein CWI25_01415 [Pseudomonas aeruginosa]AUA93237.1 hypothetical protein CWI24_01415 [Pseudomonas aeruginosa]ELQ3329479.1 hypothetical protein [Pseudomonas aeruginosa]KAA5633734.1 hypothetical protein F3H11_00925 [Pseudomonas aeruginosa]KAA5647966.1 hypothetical protein F3G63_05410 [Pseudomonas aeruginosa]